MIGQSILNMKIINLLIMEVPENKLSMHARLNNPKPIANTVYVCLDQEKVSLEAKKGSKYMLPFPVHTR